MFEMQKIRYRVRLYRQLQEAEDSNVSCISDDSRFALNIYPRKGEMQREIDTLRKSQDTATSIEPADYVASSTFQTIPQAAPSQSSPSSSHNSSSAMGQGSALIYGGRAVDAPPIRQVSSAPTFSPLIDGLRLEPRKLQDCFTLFFQHYHPILPILEARYGLEDYFAYSHLLFWTMIVTGSRRYALDPTILEILAPKVANMAALATIKISEYVPTISALLMLCVWPLPMESACDDPSPVYAGAALQLALQNGLHMLSRRQDFSESPLIKDTSQELYRARLWAWCKVICRCCNMFSGLPPSIFTDAFELEQHAQDSVNPPDPFIYWMQRLECVTSRSLSTLMQNRYEPEVVEKSNPVQAMISLFDAEILKIKRESQGHLADIWFNSMRLHIRAFNFFDGDSPSKLIRLAALYHIACEFVDNVSSRDRISDYAFYVSEQYYRTLSLAATTILRIIRSPELHPNIDQSLGEQCYFAAIRILKKRVLKNNDLNARVATILSQLWQSQRVFQQEDHSIDSLNVRIRSRGAMGVVYDCFWYWRQEYLGYLDPYRADNPRPESHERIELNLPEVEPQVDLLDTNMQPATFGEDYFLGLSEDDAFFPEWNWSMDRHFPVELTKDWQDMATTIYT